MPSYRRAIGAKVPIEKGEYFRKKFSDVHLIDKKLMIKRNDSFLFIPLSMDPDTIEKQKEKFKWLTQNQIDLQSENFELYPDRINNYKLLLDLPAELNKELPTSFDIVGTIALIKLPDNLREYSKLIGEAILNVHKNLKTIAWDKGIKGEYRIRDFEIIAGKNNTETIHKEYGIRFLMDISKAYFSPRLGKEHYRIAKLVKPGEVVLDMFAGIGPFSIMISKYSKANQIYSIDINKSALEFFIKNIDLNKVQNIFPLEGDANKILEKVPLVDRIIMNLPHESAKFLKSALKKLKPEGTIHYHLISNPTEIHTIKSELEKSLEEYGFRAIKIETNNLGSYSPKLNHYCLDLHLERL
jgi:tRNA (guanine37-N1)-methyltransferase